MAIFVYIYTCNQENSWKAMSSYGVMQCVACIS